MTLQANSKVGVLRRTNCRMPPAKTVPGCVDTSVFASGASAALAAISRHTVHNSVAIWARKPRALAARPQFVTFATADKRLSITSLS